MSRTLRALVAAPVLTLLFAAPAVADPHSRQIPIESWSWPAPATQASPKLFLMVAEGEHYDAAGTGKTMAAQVLASDLR